MLQPEGCVGLHLPTGTRTMIAMMNSGAAATIAVATVTLTEGGCRKIVRFADPVRYAGLAI